MISFKEVKTDSLTAPSYRFSAFVLFFFIFLTALVVSPQGWLSDEIVKNSVFMIGGVCVFFVVFFEQLHKKVFYFYRTPLLQILFLYILFSLFSALLSPNILSSLSDLTPGFGSPLGAVVLFFLMYGVLSIFSQTKYVIYFYTSTAVALIAFVFFQCVDLFIFPLVGVSQETFAGQMLNLPIILGFVVLFFVSVLDFFPLSVFIRLLLYVALVGSFVLLVVIPFPVVWEVLAVFLILSAAFFLLTFHKARSYPFPQVGHRPTPSFPWHAIIFSALSISLIFIGPKMAFLFEDVRNNKEMVAEVRPSLSSSLSLVGGFYGSSTKSLLFGVGNSLFGSVWNLYKPLQINETPLWHTDFEVSNSSLLTVAVTGGILCVSVLLIFHGALVFESFRFFFFRKPLQKSVNIYYLGGISFLLGGYTFTWSFLYFPSALLLLLGVGAVAAGIALLSTGVPLRWSMESVLKFSPSFGRVILGGAILLCSVLFTGFLLTKTISIIYYQKSKNALLSVGDFHQAEMLIKKALVFHTSDKYYRTFSEIKQLEVNKIIESGEVDVQKTEEIRAAVIAGNSAAQRAVEVDATNYLNWVVLGNGQYQNLLLFERKASTPPESSYSNAIKFSPLSPIPYYLKGRLLVTVGRIGEARPLLQQALLLKPDYTPAAVLLKEI